MKSFILWVFVCMLGVGVMAVSLSTAEGAISEDPGGDFAHYQGEVAPKMTRIRKLKESLNLEDYGPFDPSPSSKASIRHGPIQHGTPLMPYIPRPSSPPPSHGGIP